MFVIQIGPARVALGPGSYIIGREPEAGIHLEGGQVSRRHARLVVDWNDQATVEDLASRNGTVLNGQRLAVGEKTPVRAGDTVEVGSHRLQIGGPSRRRTSQGNPPLVTGTVTASIPVLKPTAVTVDASPSGSNTLPPVLAAGAAVGRVFILSPDETLVDKLRAILGSRQDFQIEGGRSVARIETAAQRRPKLVFIDRQLRGLDAQLIRKAREQLEGTLFGVFGELTEAEGNPLAAAVGADFYVEQPASPTLFVARLRFWLARARLGGAVALGDDQDDVTSTG